MESIFVGSPERLSSFDMMSAKLKLVGEGGGDVSDGLGDPADPCF